LDAVAGALLRFPFTALFMYVMCMRFPLHFLVKMQDALMIRSSRPEFVAAYLWFWDAHLGGIFVNCQLS